MNYKAEKTSKNDFWKVLEEAEMYDGDIKDENYVLNSICLALIAEMEMHEKIGNKNALNQIRKQRDIIYNYLNNRCCYKRT